MYCAIVLGRLQLLFNSKLPLNEIEMFNEVCLLEKLRATFRPCNIPYNIYISLSFASLNIRSRVIVTN